MRAYITRKYKHFQYNFRTRCRMTNVLESVKTANRRRTSTTQRRWTWTPSSLPAVTLTFDLWPPECNNKLCPDERTRRTNTMPSPTLSGDESMKTTVYIYCYGDRSSTANKSQKLIYYSASHWHSCDVMVNDINFLWFCGFLIFRR